MRKNPKSLYLLNFVSMWECFSFYGMRMLLVLFLVHEFQYGDEEAFSLYALYAIFVELGGVLGGVVADRYLGLKHSIIIGGVTIALGHICMALMHFEAFFFLGLGLIIVGTALFRSNVAALVGECYKKEDARKESGYTVYYAGINVGGFLATIFCGIVAESCGWHAGFGLAAFGMIFANIALLVYGKHLPISKQPIQAIDRKILCGLIVLAPICAMILYYHKVGFVVIPCLG